MKMVLDQNGRTSTVSCRRRREFWQTDGSIFEPTQQWEGHHASRLHKWLRWDDWLTLFFICRTRICPRVQVRCAAIAGRAAMETQSPMRGRSPRHRKACAGVYFDGFQTQPCQGWLQKQIDRRNCLRHSRCLAQGEASIDEAGRGMRAETNSIEIESEAKANCRWHYDFFFTKRPHSNVPPLMSDDILVNIAPSLKVRECKQHSSLANSIHNTALVRPPAGQ